MSFYTSPISSSSGGKRRGPRKPPAKRALSASEIAKNPRYHETWSAHQNLEHAEISDLPKDLVEDVNNVFDTDARIPLSWVQKGTSRYKSLSAFTSPEFLSFIAKSHQQAPSLFYDDSRSKANTFDLLRSLLSLFTIWQHLTSMLDSSEKWSEADFATTIYGRIRSEAIANTQRVQPRICLPHPVSTKDIGSEAARILKSKTIIPDCAIVIPASSLSHLSSSSVSPYTQIKNSLRSSRKLNAGNHTSFRYQATLFDRLTDSPEFGIASGFCEDKKPTHHSLEDAYRQNRMSSAAAVRQLHSFLVRAPIFGLVWCRGRVRAHVDWAKEDADGRPCVLSAPFPDKNRKVQREWHLERPEDLLQIHFLLQNIARWTTGRFRERVEEGILKLVKKPESFRPWRGGTETRSTSKKQKENISHSSDSTSEDVKVKGKRRK